MTPRLIWRSGPAGGMQAVWRWTRWTGRSSRAARARPRYQALPAGRVDALTPTMLGPADIPHWKSKPEYYTSPQLSSYFIGLNVKKIPDVNERRALALAIDRQAIVEPHLLRRRACRRLHSEGHPRVRVDRPHSRFLPARGNIAAAKAAMAKVAHPVTKLNVYFPTGPGQKEWGSPCRRCGSSSGSR